MIAGRLVLTGEVELTSPALIGSGTSERTDIDIIKDAEGRPYIPATSLIGVLKNSIRPKGMELDHLWGYTKDKDSVQSAIRCDDLTLIEDMTYPIEVRDGIKINPKTGLVHEGAKYDYEIVPAGTRFYLHIEAPYKSGEKDPLARMVKTIEQQLSRGAISVGAKTTCGFGRIMLHNAKLYDYDYSNKQDVLRWLKEDTNNQPECKDIKPYELQDGDFCISATLRLKSALMVRSYSPLPEAPDAVHIRSGKHHIIPGTSLKGAIRARAERILNTVKGSSELIEDLFGYTYDDEQEAQKRGKKKGDAKKGRITIDEVILPRFASEIQTRIKIDRFTGGTIETALLEDMPLFTSKEGQEDIKNVRIRLKQCRDHEAGLMLLVLKDLWTGDIAVGGEKSIGRGVFEGIRAEITFGNKFITIGKSLTDLPVQDRQFLEGLVRAFVDYKNGGSI
ncbi:MAG: RAMP superfamily CRISPR-associated protein [Thermodesulfovibrionales bacterium]